MTRKYTKRKPKSGPSKTDFLVISNIRVLGTDERYEVGKSWDERGAVAGITCTAKRATIEFESGEKIVLVNCPMELSGFLKRPTIAKVEETEQESEKDARGV